VTRALVVRAEAEQEIITAAEWHESRGSGLAAEFLRSIDAALAAVERAPLQHGEVLPGFRRCLLKRFPYSLIFSVSDQDVVVLACTHWRQNPRRWQKRP
jgi:plasmid stabilization system protein ParE